MEPKIATFEDLEEQFFKVRRLYQMDDSEAVVTTLAIYAEWDCIPERKGLEKFLRKFSGLPESEIKSKFSAQYN